MLRDELEAVASRYVPGQGKMRIQGVGNGLVNETYRVLRDGGTYALRVAAANPYDLGIDRAWEARLLETAVAADLAPAIEYCDPQRGILISRWVDGRSWSSRDVRRHTKISRMAELARRIHALPMPMPARLMSPTKWIGCYSAAACNGAGAIGAPHATAALRDAATSRLNELAALPSVDPVLCHSDLHAFNLIDRGPSLILLDWEYAHASDPLWDLAGWSANNDFEDELQHELLASYTGRPPTRDEYWRLRLFCWLYDYICLLWSELYLGLHRDAGQDGAALEGVSTRARRIAARLQASK
jgi:thiamine kinase-like enzyme